MPANTDKAMIEAAMYEHIIEKTTLPSQVRTFLWRTYFSVCFGENPGKIDCSNQTSIPIQAIAILFLPYKETRFSAI